MARTPSPAVLAAITACVVAAGAGAGILLQPTKDRDAPSKGPGVNIAVVAPREPVPAPGSVMDVGELADSYAHRDYAQPAVVDSRPYDVYEDDIPVYVEPRRIERPRVVASEPSPPPVIAERREAPRRWPFGFDPPGPDYAAERRERAARMDEQRRLDEERLRDRYEDAGDDPEWRDDPRRGARPGADRRGRDRQWYRSDGSRAPEPDRYD
ncbi:MAG: hypothetical protein M3Q74_04640 [Pseudomonadota bacterium]|nr:hypothetical protein [Pseudomonadota bacterium]